MDYREDIFQAPTSSPLSVRAPAGPADSDELIRRRIFGTTVLERSMPTQDFIHRLRELNLHERTAARFLGEALDSIKRGRAYDGHYIAHLLGEVSEEEFEQLSLEFVEEVREISLNEVKARIVAVLSHTTSEFTVSEMAELFFCSEDDVRRAVEAISLPDSGHSAT